MLTQQRTSKSRKLKYAAVVLALLSVLVFCFTSCGADVVPTAVNYVDGSAGKLEYNQGETFDCTGAKIEVTYSDGSKAEKAVTIDMVGSAPLALGVTNISVTYSEAGATVIGYIPVTVKDPYAAEKLAAFDKLDAAAAANKADKGIAQIVANYKEKVQAANSVDAINAVVANFDDALATWKADKAAILAAMDNADMQLLYAQLYAQFKTTVESLKAIAVSSINAASSIDEAEAVLADFKVAVNNALAEQKVYEGENKNPDTGEIGGQIGDKIAILQLIEKYTKRLNFLKGLVEDAKGVLAEGVYDEMMFGKSGKEATTGYDYVEGRLSWWEKYVTLAIDLTGVEDKINTEVGDLLKTPVDKIAELMVKGYTVVPVEYKNENGAWVDGLDATQKDVIDEWNKLEAEAKRCFGDAGYVKLIREYGPAAPATPYISEIYTQTVATQTALKTVRDAAKTAGLIGLINAAVAATDDPATTDVDEKRVAVDAAWAAIKDWGAANGVVTINVAADTIEKYLDFTNKSIANAILAATIIDNSGTPGDGFLRGGHETVDGDNTVYSFWAADAYNKDYVIKYFIPNLQDLIDATIEQAATETKAVVNAIKEVLISYTNLDVDADASIKAAEDALVAYKATYGQENYTKHFVVDGADEFAAKVEAARAAYINLQKLAKEANDAIALYLELIENDLANIETKDYEAETLNAESGAKLLKDAYVKYLAFAEANTSEAGNIYTDVIEYSNATTKSENETKLMDCMTQYITLAYAEQRVVKTRYIISSASNARVDLIPQSETTFREAVTKYAVKMENEIINDASYKLDTSDLTNFNYDDVLKTNLDKVEEAANKVATFIGDTNKLLADFQAAINPI